MVLRLQETATELCHCYGCASSTACVIDAIADSVYRSLATPTHYLYLLSPPLLLRSKAFTGQKNLMTPILPYPPAASPTSSSSSSLGSYYDGAGVTACSLHHQKCTKMMTRTSVNEETLG
jgi:hypothetical protein